MSIGTNIKNGGFTNTIGSPLDVFFSRKLNTTNLSSDIVVTDEGAYLEVAETFNITVVDATGATPDALGNKWIEIYEGPFFYQSEISNVSGNDLTLSVPIGFPFTTGATVQIVDINQNRDFTVAGIGSQEYSFTPGLANTADWMIIRLLFVMEHSDESDSSTYGDIIGGLDEGIYFYGKGTLFPRETGLPKDLRLRNSVLNIKKNIDYKATAFDVTYEPKGGNPQSPQFYGTSVRKTFNGADKSGTVIPVRASRFEATVQVFRDDLSSLETHRTKATGRQFV